MIQHICPPRATAAAKWKQAPGCSLRLRIAGEICRPRNPGYYKDHRNRKTPGEGKIENCATRLSLKSGLYAIEDPRCRKKSRARRLKRFEVKNKRGKGVGIDKPLWPH